MVELDEQTQRSTRNKILRQPVRIVIDSQNRVMPEHRIVQQPGESCSRVTAGRFYEWPGNGVYLADSRA
ncbi:hypothetical protein ACNKHX_02115 [Shigella flexneri]